VRRTVKGNGKGLYNENKARKRSAGGKLKLPGEPHQKLISPERMDLRGVIKETKDTRVLKQGKIHEGRGKEGKPHTGGKKRTPSKNNIANEPDDIGRGRLSS